MIGRKGEEVDPFMVLKFINKYEKPQYNKFDCGKFFLKTYL